MNDDVATLTNLINNNKFNEAEVLCLTKLKATQENSFWLTQLGYIYFLNQEDFSAYYERCLPIFTKIAGKDKTDQNALFWLAYLSYIIHHDTETSQSKLQHLLRLNPEHPYANLVMAGFSKISNAEKVGYLTATLQQQPANLRAAKQYIEILLEQKKFEEAYELYTKLDFENPYTENNYGIMNEYINDIFTAASHSAKISESLKSLITGSNKDA